ncbi:MULTISPECIES: BrnT family toxin [Hydrogenophaga]|uniref:BrnT family toxin n=2 Tax=Hydrogenophaga TaxID=47420 RepID=A0ABW2QFC8_9BURK
MDFEWDGAKSDACFVERGFDFAYAAQAFFDPDRLISPDLRRSYGEDRFRLLGRIDTRVFVLVYTSRPQATRIISARKANTREVKQYENGTRED